MKQFFRTAAFTLLWVVLMVLVLSSLGYIYIFRPGQNFWDNAISNWLATLAALIGGVPIGLLINRVIQRQESVNRFDADRLKEKEILILIKEELDFSLNSLFITNRKGNATAVALQPYKSDLWDALVAGEELKYIYDPQILNRIASAYYILKVAREIETQAYIALRTSAITFHINGKSVGAGQLLLNDARILDGLFENNLGTAISEIDRRLGLLA